MSTSYEEILKQYSNSDCNRRLDIFLQYPDLRNDFFEIETEEMGTNFKEL